MVMMQTTIQGHSYTLISARCSDVPFMSAIIRDVFDEYGWVFVELDELPDFVQYNEYYSDPQRARLYALTDSQGTILGSIALKVNAYGAYLSRVYLSQSHRGLGLGKWMTAQVMQIAINDGFKSLHLWTDTRFLDAHRMYERLGFQMSGELRSLHDVNHSFEYKMYIHF
jgi:putative acetyltransferase